MLTDLDAVRTLLDRLGIAPEDLLRVQQMPNRVPTISDYVDRVAAAVSPGTHRVYGTYWRRVVELWGERRLDEPTPLETKQLAEQIRAQVVVRRNSRGGRVAAEHLIAALRCLCGMRSPTA